MKGMSSGVSTPLGIGLRFGQAREKCLLRDLPMHRQPLIKPSEHRLVAKNVLSDAMYRKLIVTPEAAIRSR